MYQRLKIERLGQRGEGVAQGRDATVFVPYALPGDEVMADVDGERGTLADIVSPSLERIEPFCPYYSVCGGCAVQALEDNAYRAWKRGLVTAALEHAGVKADVDALQDAHGDGRRRATFHARIFRDGLNRPSVRSGFMRARAHEIVDIEACPILAPAMENAPAAARAIAIALQSLDKPLDITLTATMEGLDADFRGTGKINEELQQALVKVAARLDLARISNHGEIVIERRAPKLRMGRALLTPPPGAFLQATQAGEDALAALITDRIDRHAKKARHVADLFAGVGTFALRLAERASVHAVESEMSALSALTTAARNERSLKDISTETRDLFRRPLAADELKTFDAVVIDPPRAGADAQMRELAKSSVPLVVSVSCNTQTFARDARILIDGGYTMGPVTPVDQFRHSPHVEMIAAFTKAPKPASKRRLLG
jgi:23S rRNA (uracil1939-C5)-methyltransferase